MPLRVYYTPSERGPYMKIAFTIKPSKKGGSETREFKIDDTARISFRFVQRRNRKSDDYTSSSSSTDSEQTSPTPISISISLKKCSSVERDYVTRIKLKFFGFNGQLVCPDGWTQWIDMGKITTEYENDLTCSYNSVQLEASMTVMKTEVITFAKLYDDTVTTDFSISTLTTKDGDAGVAFHRNCLLAHSDMFKTLFQSGDFADKRVFKVGIKEVTDQTVRQLKDYVYLGKLPEDDVRPLLLLAKCYLFENLQSECITKLVETVCSDNLHSLMAFACENNIPDLAISLMQQTPEDVVFHAHLLDRRQKRKWDNEDREPDRTGNKKHKKLMSTIHKGTNF